MIIREGYIHHRSDHNLILNDHRPFLNGVHSQDSTLRRIRNWGSKFGKRLSREEAEFGIAPKAYVFTTERRSNGHRLVFTYDKSLAEEIKHLGAAKKTPDKFSKGEFQKVKKTFITTLLTRRTNNDFGYFDIVEKNF